MVTAIEARTGNDDDDDEKRRKYKWWNAYTVIMHMMFTISISPYVASKCIHEHMEAGQHADGSTSRCRRRKYK